LPSSGYVSTTFSQLIGPPVGGALYGRFGIRGPCAFSIVVIFVDLIGRNMVIERKEALTWGFDPASSIDTPFGQASVGQPDPQYGTFASETDSTNESGWQSSRASLVEGTHSVNSLLDQETTCHEVRVHQTQHDSITIFEVIRGLCMSSRAVAAVTNSFVLG